MNLITVFSNQVLVMALIAWFLAQTLKVPWEYFQARKLNWALLLSSGGMPSSHSAMVSAAANGIGLYYGFANPIFAVGAIVAIVVIYDATGIRRQAGKHAEMINAMIKDLTSGHPLQGEQLREVLGHTPLEALGGLVLGLIISTLYWVIWR